MTYSTFQIGDIVLKQTKGIPMGSPMSPALAVILCAFFEHKFLATLGQDSSLVTGLRYVDDVFVLAPVKSTHDDPETTLIDRVWQGLKSHCYPKDLELEDTGEAPETIHLESRASVVDGRLTLQYRCKNEDAMRTTGAQHFLNLQPSWSYTRTATKKGTILTTFLRAAAASSSKELFMKKTPEMINEIMTLGYSRKFIQRQLNKAIYSYHLNFD